MIVYIHILLLSDRKNLYIIVIREFNIKLDKIV